MIKLLGWIESIGNNWFWLVFNWTEMIGMKQIGHERNLNKNLIGPQNILSFPL